MSSTDAPAGRVPADSHDEFPAEPDKPSVPAASSPPSTGSASVELAQASSPGTQPSTPVEPRQTIAGLSAQIVQNASARASRFDVQLTPEGLGRVDVAMQIDANGKVSATLSFDRPEAAALVRSHAGELHAALAGLGLALGPDAIAIGHVQPDHATGSGEQSRMVAAQAQGFMGSGGDFRGDSNAQPQFQAPGTGGAMTGQGGGQPQGERPAPQFGGVLSFALAADAAEVVDQRQAYAARLSSRGLDIRI